MWELYNPILQNEVNPALFTPALGRHVQDVLLAQGLIQGGGGGGGGGGGLGVYSHPPMGYIVDANS